MILGYESFLSKIKKNSEEKVKSAVLANWYGDTIMSILTCAVGLEILGGFINKSLFIVIYIVALFLLMFHVSTRRCGFGLTNNKFIYVKFSKVFHKEKEVYEIPFESIKNIRVRKIFSMIFVQMSFISNDKKFKRIKFNFNSWMIGFSFKEQGKSSKEIYSKLLEREKIIDRGDF